MLVSSKRTRGERGRGGSQLCNGGGWCEKAKGVDEDKNVRLETASSSALRDGMKYLRVEERRADMMTGKGTRGGEGGIDSGSLDSELKL